MPSGDQEFETKRGNGGETHQQIPEAGRHEARDHLTTNQGIRVSDNQNSLKSGARGPTLLEDFVLREKIFHFDHERIPERIVHARGTGRARLFRSDRRHFRPDEGGPVQEGREDRRCSCASRPSPAAPGSVDTPRDVRGFAVKFYTTRGQLGSGRQQHPGLLHPGRDQVSRSGPRGEDGGGPRLSAGGQRARHLLGLGDPDAGDHPHADVGDVRPHDPALAADDRRVRRPHLPAGQRRRQDDLRASSTGSRSSACNRPSGTRR